jgi:nitrogen regulatory protein PII 2
MTARTVYGRGKKKIQFDIIEQLIDNGDVPDAHPRTLENISEAHRLLAKRMIQLVVQDDEVDEVIDIIIQQNQTGNMGDGRIFVMPVTDAVRVRTGEHGTAAV